MEDLKSSAHVISRLIAKFGEHEVTVVHDGLTALQTILDLHPDVVLLDIPNKDKPELHMPRGKALDLACCGPVEKFDAKITGTFEYSDIKDSDVVVITSGAPRKPGIDTLNALLQRAGIALNQRQLESLWRFHNLLRRRNAELNLTRIFSFESIVVKHYVDCLCVGDRVSLPSPLLDVGTGPGFPGVPLKIRYPDLHVILAEPRPERVAFLGSPIDAEVANVLMAQFLHLEAEDPDRDISLYINSPGG